LLHHKQNRQRPWSNWFNRSVSSFLIRNNSLVRNTLSGQKQKPASAQGPTRAHVQTNARELELFLDKIFTEEWRKNTFAGQLSSCEGRRCPFSKGYGFVDLERTKPVSTERTIFRIGSISKLFTRPRLCSWLIDVSSTSKMTLTVT